MSRQFGTGLLLWSLAFLFGSPLAPRADSSALIEYLGDHPEYVLASEQGWGLLGWNTAAHQGQNAGAPLAIAGKSYAKGLGHHANGSITIILDDEFVSFDAEVGLQPCGAGGSVVFRVFLDGRKMFDSGPMFTTTPPKQVHVDISGGSELRLESNDAGDGITCDMANWADARLGRIAASSKRPAFQRVDIAPFGMVIALDPTRTNGARANRTQEYAEEDVFLEKPILPDSRQRYFVPASTNQLICVGLKWLNRRALTELGLALVEPKKLPPLHSIQVQAWFGESAWQGAWRPLKGELEIKGDVLWFRISNNNGPLQTSKIRWTFPSGEGVMIRKLLAYTRSRWDTTEVLVESDPTQPSSKTTIDISNGEIISSNGRAVLGSVRSLNWNRSSALRLVVRHSRASSMKSDPTVLLFQNRRGAFGVAVEDVLTQPRVFVAKEGISVARYPSSQSLKAFQEQLHKPSTLEMVNSLPDQTLQQAFDKTHHEAQKEGPVLLSLAGDNLKFILERNGILRFPSVTNMAGDWPASGGEIRPVFGSGKLTNLQRRLDGDWLPIPVIENEESGVLYRQRTFVAPLEAPGEAPNLFNPMSACVIEYAVTNLSATTAPVSLKLRWLAHAEAKQDATLSATGSSFELGENGLKGCILAAKLTPLQIRTEPGVCSVSGQLPPQSQASFMVLLSTASTGAMGSEVSVWRSKARQYWERVLKPAAQIETPDTNLNSIILSSQVRCLIDSRSEADGKRIAPWIAAMSYGPLESEAHSVIRGMDYLGHDEFARRSLDFFIHRYNTNGFLTTGYTTFGTAWHLWTLGEHYELNRDQGWLHSNASEIIRAGEWIIRQTKKTQESKQAGENRPAEYGLMPPGVLADWNAFAYHYALNAYYYAGLRHIATVLLQLGNGSPSEDKVLYERIAKRFNNHAASLRENIIRAYRWTQAQAPVLKLRNDTWIPHYPSQVHSPGKLADFFPGQDAGRSWCYDVELGAHQLVPAGVLSADEPEVSRMLDHMEDVQFLADGWFDYPAAANEKDWFNLGGFSKVQPYYTRNCEIYAMRDEVKPFLRSYFNTLAAMLNPEILTFWEHFNHSGAWDKTHETGYFLHQTRTMLLSERGRELWLAPMVTSNWLGNGLVLSVSNAPSKFGSVSYRLESHISSNRIEVTVSPPIRNPPDRIVLRLRHPGAKPIKTVQVDGHPHHRFDSVGGLVFLKSRGRQIPLKIICWY